MGTRLARVIGCAAAVVLAGSGLVAAVPANASSQGQAHPHSHRSARYLALGDSVPFGFNPLLTVPARPSAYVGYPELIGAFSRLRVTNLSCPGQTSAGFNSATGDDNGCRGFRSVAELHENYVGTQLEAATTFLAENPRTKAVTLMIGANDLFVCQRTTPKRCTDPAEIQAVLGRFAANLQTTLATLRTVYNGRIVAVSYYATNYNDPQITGAVQALNAVTAATVQAFGGQVADGYGTFAAASAFAGGDPCAAGLLIKLPTGGCDIHPSRRGARLLSGVVYAAITR